MLFIINKFFTKSTRQIFIFNLEKIMDIADDP